MSEKPRTDRKELEILRVSLGRVAQATGVQTDAKPVLTKSSCNELCEMAKGGLRLECVGCCGVRGGTVDQARLGEAPK